MRSFTDIDDASSDILLGGRDRVGSDEGDKISRCCVTAISGQDAWIWRIVGTADSHSDQRACWSDLDGTATATGIWRDGICFP